MTFNLNISGHTTNQMLCSIVYKKISDLLINRGRTELFQFVKSIKITNGKLTIKTEKPIVNSELQLYREDIEDLFVKILLNSGLKCNDIKIYFR